MDKCIYPMPDLYKTPRTIANSPYVLSTQEDRL